jgi:hypothetical protein
MIKPVALHNFALVVNADFEFYRNGNGYLSHTRNIQNRAWMGKFP